MTSAHTASTEKVTVASQLEAVVALTEERLRRLLHDEECAVASLDDRAAEPIEALGRLVLGHGKRLRPAFCHWGHRAVTGEDVAPGAVVDVGAALELLHAFALAHDDIMDESSTRRGEPTTHVAQAELHRRRSWRGGSDRYGESVAILVGDLGHTYARRLLREAPLSVLALWDQLEVELVVGQYLDVVGTAGGGVSLPRAVRIAELKSARYTVMRPLAIGAALGGSDPVPPALLEYGTAVGVAFQLRDDVLGACGSSDVTGKPTGDDLREGKPTPLVAVARERATPSEHAVLDTVGCADIDVDEVIAVLEGTGALQEVERRISELTGQGISAVTAPRSGLHPPTASLLADVAEVLCGRVA